MRRLTRRRFVKLCLGAFAALVAACTGLLRETPSAGPSISPSPSAGGAAPGPTVVPSATDRSSEGTAEPPLQPVADFIYLGGPILTMDPALPDAEAIAVAGGQIVSVGQRAAVLRHADDATAVINLGRAALLPGFVDAHSHFFQNTERAGSDLAGMSAFIAQQGITTTAELFTTADLLEALRRLEENGQLGVRTSAYMAANDACGDSLGDWWREHPPTRGDGEMLRVGGVKIYSDGGACNLPAVGYEYLGGLGNGDLYFSAGDLARLVGRVEDAGHQAAIHALGDRAIQAVLEAFEQVLPGGSNPRRHRMEHSAATRPDLRARHSEVGVVTTIFGAFSACFFAGRLGGFRGRTPPEYLEWEWPWRDLLAQNPAGHFAWHADWPVFETGAVGHLAGFVTRGQVHPEDGSYCDPLPEMAGHVITVEQALRLMTVGAAYALERDEEVGSLTVGKLADLVVLSADPRTVAPRELHDLQVLATLVGSRVRWCAPGSEALCPPADRRPSATPLVTRPPSSTAGPSAPISGPNVALRAAASASAAATGQPPEHAVDGDSATSWSAGSHPVQWISLDLGSLRTIRRVRLVVEQFPPGETVHRLLASELPGAGQPYQLHEFRGRTTQGDVLDVAFDEPRPVRHLRVETVSGPSWVAWAEIEAFE